MAAVRFSTIRHCFFLHDAQHLPPFNDKIGAKRERSAARSSFSTVIFLHSPLLSLVTTTDLLGRIIGPAVSTPYIETLFTKAV